MLSKYPYFELTLRKVRRSYCEYYANLAVEGARDDGLRVQISDPGDYEDGHLNAFGEGVWDSEYAEREAYFDESVRLFLVAYEEAKANEELGSPTDYAYEAILKRDPDMDLPGEIYTAFEDAAGWEALDIEKESRKFWAA
jgi:hypothetical protein